MKHYDFAFSCGFSCGVTQALRAADLQFASFPFDWTASPTFLAGAKTIANGFERWMEREDLELVDVRRGGINKHIYRNRRTGYGFVHDFSSFRTFDENFPQEAAKYARRIERLKDCLSKATSVLAVYAECPKCARVTDAELLETRRVLSASHPSAKFDLLYFYVKPDCSRPCAEQVAEGVVAVGLDYRTFENGELHHQIDNTAMTAYLRENVAVTDVRTPEEKAAYDRQWARQDGARWHGGNAFETFVNRTAFRLYRRLERFLVRKGLVPRERPLWFV